MASSPPAPARAVHAGAHRAPARLLAPARRAAGGARAVQPPRLHARMRMRVLTPASGACSRSNAPASSPLATRPQPVYDAKDLVAACEALPMTFSPFQQNDAAEFLMLLSAHLEEQLKGTPQERPSHPIPSHPSSRGRHRRPPPPPAASARRLRPPPPPAACARRLADRRLRPPSVPCLRPPSVPCLRPPSVPCRA